MNDTSPHLEAVHRRMLMSLSPGERMRMGCDMFDTARSIVLASLRETSDEDLPARLFLRFYGNDFPPDQIERILARIREYHSTRSGDTES